MDDASLDEFLDTGEAEEDAPASESEELEPTDEDVDTSDSGSDGSADTQPTATVDTQTVEPATVTATWTESGAHCDRCGEETQRLWTDDEAAVCRDCKEW
jgi:formylmethanofuran dehydrogenase subunit E